jgi:transposase
MGMGTRKRRQRQEQLWITHAELATAPGHPFYKRLNQLLDGEKFDEFCEGECAQFYADNNGRPSLTPGTYFRLMLVGYFEGIDSERGIAWRVADSLGLRQYLGFGLDERTPDHSTISRTRRLIDVETHQKVFFWVLGLLADRELIKGKTVGIDGTTLEANAAMRSIVRRDNGASYEEFLKGLARESGIPTPRREDLARLDCKRKKKGANKEWVNPHDEDARITKMKDGSGAGGDAAEGDTTTIIETLAQAGENVADLIAREAAEPEPGVNLDGIEEVVGDKGYHSGAALVAMEGAEVRTYIPEKKQAGKRHWIGKKDQQQAVYANRLRVSRTYGKSLLRKRGELIERSFAHCYDTGAMRRTHLRGHQNILKRQLIHVGAFNLSLIFRYLIGAGTPRELKKRLALLVFVLECLAKHLRGSNRSSNAPTSPQLPSLSPHRVLHPPHCHHSKIWGSATDC